MNDDAGGQGEALGVRQQRGRLAAHELREGAVGRLVALDLEVRVHRIVARARRQEIGDAGIDHAQLADLEAPLARRLGAERGHQHDRAAARDVQVLVVEVEDGDGHAAGGEHRVVGQARVEDVAERVVGADGGHAAR